MAASARLRMKEPNIAGIASSMPKRMHMGFWKPSASPAVTVSASRESPGMMATA